MRIYTILLFIASLLTNFSVQAQINTDKMLANARNALYFEDYVLSIQYFNQVIRAKPHLAEPYFYRAIAKLSLEDFRGAEEDCTMAIERHPYITDAYMCRGIARQNLNDLDGAISDYQTGLIRSPENKTFLTNIAICYTTKKEYDEAEKAFDKLIKTYPSMPNAYMARGSMYLEKGDTINAVNDIGKALKLDKYNSRAYALRGILRFEKKEYQGALDDLNEAIKLEPNFIAYILNRGIVRYHLNDLRGTMADYDLVITYDPSNLIALYNRGLLRMQVGDNNRAIEDFTKVLMIEPDNYFAYYNRSLLNSEVGNFRNAIEDITMVIERYPQFVPAYYLRSEAKRKLQDRDGAEKDYWTALTIERDYREGKLKNNSSLANSDSTLVDDNSDSDEKVRKAEDKNINKFNRLMMANNENTTLKREFENELRGRVQDRNTNVDLQPMFLLTYYERTDKISQAIVYLQSIEEFNRRGDLKWTIKVTNDLAPLTEDQIARHFESIDAYSKQIGNNRQNDVINYFGRSIDFMLVQDYSSAIEELDRVLEKDPNFTLALYNRAVLRYKQLEYQRSANKSENEFISSGSLNLSPSSRRNSSNQGFASAMLNQNEDRNTSYEQVVKDLDKLIAIEPSNFYAIYNRGNIKCAEKNYRYAIIDYTEAIRIEPDFAEAYYNRGLVYLFLGDNQKGIMDLSKAGEMGIVSAYNIIKRISD
ncbi:MAG: tetratricopeptide repeat protein [Bacteroidales bacterium]